MTTSCTDCPPSRLSCRDCPFCTDCPRSQPSRQGYHSCGEGRRGRLSNTTCHKGCLSYTICRKGCLSWTSCLPSWPLSIGYPCCYRRSSFLLLQRLHFLQRLSSFSRFVKMYTLLSTSRLTSGDSLDPSMAYACGDQLRLYDSGRDCRRPTWGSSGRSKRDEAKSYNEGFRKHGVL